MIRHRVTFTPRELFSRMQGAWFEPRLGSMWQENTGATPTTSGGQTVGKLVDLTTARVASQSTAANRPVYGVRRNLLTYSEDFSNTAWGEPWPGYKAIVVGSVITDDDNTKYLGISNSLRTTSEYHTYTAYINKTTGAPANYPAILTSTYFGEEGCGAVLNTTTGSATQVVSNLVGLNTSNITPTISVRDCGDRWALSITAIPTSGRDFSKFIFLPAYNTDGTGTLDNTATGSATLFSAQLELGSVATPYQKITTATDYDPGPYPALAHDSTDSLSVALPAINVRRNLLTYSEQFDNAAWTTMFDQTVGASYLIDKNIYAQTLIANSAVYSHRKQAFTAVVGNIYTASIHVKKTGSKSYNALFQANLGLARYCAILVNTYTGVCTAVTGSTYDAPVAAPITADKDDCWRVSLTFAPLVSGIEIQIYSSVNASGGSLTSPSAGDNAFGGVQLELGAVATNYQKITDWTSEQYSSAGSVYFATPSGMSCLHNQSIGTTYNLPAPQTDIYGTVITPARLAPPLEQRLAQYMHRLAGLSDADFFWQEQATDGMTGQLLTDDNDIILLRA